MNKKCQTPTCKQVVSDSKLKEVDGRLVCESCASDPYIKARLVASRLIVSYSNETAVYADKIITALLARIKELEAEIGGENPLVAGAKPLRGIHMNGTAVDINVVYEISKKYKNLDTEVLLRIVQSEEMEVYAGFAFLRLNGFVFGYDDGVKLLKLREKYFDTEQTYGDTGDTVAEARCPLCDSSLPPVQYGLCGMCNFVLEFGLAGASMNPFVVRPLRD